MVSPGRQSRAVLPASLSGTWNSANLGSSLGVQNLGQLHHMTAQWLTSSLAPPAVTQSPHPTRIVTLWLVQGPQAKKDSYQGGCPKGLESLRPDHSLCKVLAFLKVKVFVTQSCLTLCTVACQALLSVEFSRQECWSGLPLPSPEDLSNPGIEPGSLSHQGSPSYTA